MEKLFTLICRLLSVGMVMALALMVVMVFGNVVLRYGFNSGITMSEELSRWLFLWLIFMGAVVAVRERSHMGVDLLVALLPRPLQKVALLCGHALMLYVTWLMYQGALQQVRINWGVEAPVTGLNTGWLVLSGLVFAVLTGLMLLVDFWRIATNRLTLEEWHMPQGLEPTAADVAAHPNKN